MLHSPPALPRRALVTGGCGFIGSQITRRLLAAGVAVDVLDDLSVGCAENLPSHPALRLHIGSVLDPRAVRAAGREADLVLHLAGLVGMRLAKSDRARSWRVSAAGTHHVLAQTGDAPAVLFSSSAVYGAGTPGQPMSEAHSIERETALEYDGGQPGYASGKWELERLAREEAGRGRPVQVLRPFNVVGPGQSGRYGMVLPTFVAAALCRRPLVIFDDGLQTRSFADVARFADCVLRLITSAEAWHDGARGTNVGAPTETRILDLARIVLHETGSSSTLRSIPYELVFPDSRDVRGRLPDVTRLGNLIGEVRWPPIAEIVRRCVERLAGDRMNEIRSLRP